MPGNYDNVIREVMNSTSTKPTQVGDVIQMPPMMQNEQPTTTLEPYEEFSPRTRFEYDKRMPRFFKSLNPANEADIANMILRG